MAGMSHSCGLKNVGGDCVSPRVLLYLQVPVYDAHLVQVVHSIQDLSD